MKNMLFELKEGLIISLKALQANKARAILTTMGIVIGITSVVLMSTAIKGIDNAFQTGVASLGSDNLYVDKWAWFDNDIPWWELRNRREISMDDFRKFKDLAKLPIAISPSKFTNKSLKNGDKLVESVMVIGTDAEYLKTTNLEFADGRFFTGTESDGSRNVVVLGHEIAKELFPTGDGLEKYIKMQGKKFKVVGVLAEQGSWVMGNFNPDVQAFIPIGCVFKYFSSQSRGSITINVRAPNPLMVDAVKEETIGIMRRVRGLSYDEIDDFSINQQEGLLDNINQTVGVIQIAGLFITGLSLFVGAIGIMNIMFVSVKERTREIGIRKAIGAKKRAILGQFLSESAIICLLGGFVGLIFAVLLSMVIDQFLPTTVQFDSVILAIVISLLTGLVSGYAPAYSAARMDPVEALRYE
ncbi:MAG: ABC transporter permease [Bacteroidetes bacterium]|nr:ABC transporter permease [Bacteroidota bacterium]